MKPDLERVDVALAAVRALFHAAELPFKIAGGLAVIHHGYERLTNDVDVLVAKDAVGKLAELLPEHGFSQVSAERLCHDTTRVRIDLLREGRCLRGPRAAAPLPSPLDVAGSDRDPEVVALPVLIDLKIDAGRRQDIADVVRLLMRLDDGAYIALEAAVRAVHRSELAELRDEALQELAWDDANGV